MLRELVLATRNRDKALELSALLGDLGIKILTLAHFPGAPEVMEDGESCRENAVKKATEIARHTGLVAVADDTGLEVQALQGRPGPYAARYAGEGASYEDNWRKLLAELKGVPRDRRHARFVTVAAIVRPGTQPRVVEGVLDGMIAEKPAGEHGFGYDPVFFIPQLGKTLAELPREEKNRISHRARAFLQAKEILRTM
jgi:XTP/dITP diphosphohydrolase